MLGQYARVRTILDRAEEIENEEPLGAAERSKPFPPATVAEIAAFEAKLGYALPPSYREFLRLHNGWQCFWGDSWIAGVSGKARAFVQSRARAARTWVGSESGWDPKRDLVIGADDNGGFLVLAREAGRGGERAILDCVAGVVIPQNTFSSFADLVAKQLRYRSKDVQRLPKPQRILR